MAVSLSSHQKHYIKKNIRKQSVSQMAVDLKLPEKQIRKYLQKHGLRESSPELSNPVDQENVKIVDFASFSLFIHDNFRSFILLFFLVLFCYTNSISNGFVSDDIEGIVRNVKFESFKNINSIQDLNLIPYYIIFKINPQNTALFRLINIFHHLISTFLIFIILFLTTKRKSMGLITASLFAVHPILVESVSWISGLPYNQYTLYFLLSFFLYLVAPNNRKAYYWSIFFFLLALIASIKAIALFSVFILYEISFGSWKANIKRHFPYVLLGIIFTLMAVMQVGQRISNLSSIKYTGVDKGGLYNPLVQIPVAVSTYFKLLVWPQKLTLYQTELVFSIGGYVLFGIIFSAYLALLFYGWKKNRMVFFWGSFFLIALAPTLTPFKISWVVAERYVYTSTIGIFVMAALAFEWLVKKYYNYKEYFYIGLAIIIMALSVRTIIRNIDWQDEDHLWVATAKYSPSGASTHNNLGDVYARQGKYDLAIEEFKKAIEIAPEYDAAYHNLGNTYEAAKKHDLALESYQRAVSINPGIWQSWQRLAAINLERHDLPKAYEYAKKAQEIEPNNPKVQQLVEFIEKQINQP